MKQRLSFATALFAILVFLLSGSHASLLKRQTLSVSKTALVIAVSTDVANEAVSILNEFNQPAQVLVVPQTGTSLPALETVSGSTSVGNFGLIVIIGLASYDYGSTGWASAITSDQFTALYAYQLKYNVRMVHLDGYPGNFKDVTPAVGPVGC